MEKVVLFTQKNSVYADLGCKCYGIQEDARTYMDKYPVIAHPPCRAWGKLKGQAKPRPGEKELTYFALDVVNKNGGVLEHPKASDIWKVGDLSKGFILTIQQKDFGHVARKDTNLYIVGIDPCQIPSPPITLSQADGKVEFMDKKDREKTPVDLAIYLLNILERINYEKAFQNEW